MFELKIETHFAAAHQLKMVAEKSENLHGHNWKVEVVLKGERLDKSGILMDFGEVKSHVADIIKQLDHQFLNELEIFNDDTPPSSENIARFIAHSLDSKMKCDNARVARVSAWESDNACATYICP